jgi:putative SOS response-associated peptidase YedK
MCGRYQLIAEMGEVGQYFQAAIAVDLPPRYNIAPGQLAPVVRQARDGGFEVALLRWGLIPYWAKDAKIGYNLINARCETVTSKPAFREAFQRRRCLAPASGFYEWKDRAGQKYPHLIQLPEDALFALAGLWERWHDKQTGELIESFTILTCAANRVVAQLHDRMPVIIERKDFAAWFDLDNAHAADLLRPFPPERMRVIPVSRRLNSGRIDDPSLLIPDDEPQ